MRQTLFYIPNEVAGVPLFGVGLLLGVWAVASIAILGWLVRRQGFNAETRSYLPVLGVLGLIIAFIMPLLAEPAGIPIRGYGVMLLLGVVSGVSLAVYRGAKRGIEPDLIFSLAFWMFGAGIVGARAFYVIEYWEPQFHRETLRETLAAIVNVTQGGLVVYGSLIGAGIAAVLFIRKHRLPALPIGDVIAPGMVLGLAIGRIGCFLNGCCFGGICELPWAVTFPSGSPPFKQQVERGQIAPHGIHFAGDERSPPVVARLEPDSPAGESGLASGNRIVEVNGQQVDTVSEAQLALLGQFGEGRIVSVLVAEDSVPKNWVLAGEAPRSRPVHPAQLYAAIDALLLLGFMLAYEPFSRRDGELVAIMLTLHPISRFLLEVIRVDEAFVFGTRMSISQNLSLLILAGAIALWFYILRQPVRRAPQATSL